MAKPRTIARAVVGVAILAVLDTHVFHWSVPVPGAAGPAQAATAPPGNESVGTSHGWSTPVPPGSFQISDLDNPHHDYPSLDIGVPTGTPVHAVRGGVVTWVGDDCGKGIRVDDTAGVRWTYCHADRRIAENGATVNAGDQIAVSGWTGNVQPAGPAGAHLHLQIYVGGALRCPQALLPDLYRTGAGRDPATLPTRGCIS